MSIELTQDLNQLIRRVEFFPYEWSSNLLAVCFNDSVKLFVYNDSSFRKDENEFLMNSFMNKENDSTQSSKQKKLQLIATIPFQQKIEQFSWSPKSSISALKQNISFVVSDCTQSLVFCNFTLKPNQEEQSINDNIKFVREKIDADSIFSISYDTYNGEYLAFTADNFCYLYDCLDNKIKCRFVLQSPGINICWNRSERSKFMVGEKSGLIRVYSIETLKPVFTLMCNLKIENFPLLSFDWCETNPEVIIANSNCSIFIWNTSKSCLPDGSVDNFVKLRNIKLSKVKENVVGFTDGRDAASKLTIMNVKSNQIIYQSENFKLFSSFSFNAVLPLVALSTEQRIVLIKTFN